MIVFRVGTRVNILDSRAQWWADKQRERHGDGLKPPSGGGTSGDVTGVEHELRARITRLEGALCAVFVLLAGMVAGLYLYANVKFDTVNERLGAVQVQAAQTSGKIDLLLERTTQAASNAEPVASRRRR